MKITTFIVDAFTDKPFKGNAAGICLLIKPLDVSSMQSIATELKHSETAFIQNLGSGKFFIRYFTPTTEISFCGHATLGACKIAFDKLGLKEVEFTTHSGLVLTAEKKGTEIIMKFPLYETIPYTVKNETLVALGITNYISSELAPTLDMLVIEVGDRQTIERLNPDYKLLAQSDSDLKEVTITCSSLDGQYDFYSRCFCPWIGIDEDPVTGAAHSVLAKYWQDKLGKSEMKAYQCSERGGYLHLKVKSESLLEVTSNAVIILEGEINL